MNWREQPFEPGEVITFAGDRYTVIENYGTTGVVDDGSGCKIDFHWSFQGEVCKRVEYKESCQLEVIVETTPD